MSSIIEIRHEIMQKEGDWWDELDAEEQRFLDESAGEANRDEVVSHESVMAEAESLLRM